MNTLDDVTKEAGARARQTEMDKIERDVQTRCKIKNKTDQQQASILFVAQSIADHAVQFLAEKSGVPVHVMWIGIVDDFRLNTLYHVTIIKMAKIINDMEQQERSQQQSSQVN